MGLAKKTSVNDENATDSGSLKHFKDLSKETAVVEALKAESGTAAALSRLSVAPKSETVKAIEKTQYKQRDLDKEARGKTRCVQFEAALMSPAIAGMQFNTMEEYLKLVKQAADAGVAYTFGE